MATFNAGTVQASIEIDQTALSGSVSDAIGQVRQMGAQGAQAGEQAGKQTGKGFAGAMGLSIEGALDQVKDKIKDKLSAAMESGAGIAKIAGAGVGLALAASLLTAVSFEPIKAKLTAQLGLTETESARIGGVAGKLYGANYGEGLEDVNAALRSVIQNVGGMRDASEADLQSITAKVMSVSSAFDQDLGATTRAVGQMMKTGMAKDANEALDIIAKGFQVGADKSEDFLDTLNEYGTQFRKLGIDGKDATGLISQGLQAGARDADLVADAFKEFSIRAIDGSELTSKSLTALGLNANVVSGAVAAGGSRAREATDLVLDSLRNIKDPAEKAAIATGLFGTQSEDLGAALDALDLTTAAEGLGEVAGTAEQVDKVMGDTAQGGLTSIFRGFQLLGDTIGTALLPVLKPVIAGVLTLTGYLGDLIGWVMDLPGPLLLAAGALAGWLIIQSLAPAVMAFAGSLGVAATAVRGFLASLGPIGIIAAAAGIAMSFLMDSTNDNEEVIQQATDRWARLVGTLDQVSGAVTDATRAQLTAEAQQSGMLDTLDQLGVSTKDYIDASSGVAGAQERLGSSVEAAAAKVLNQSEAYRSVSEALAGAGVSQAEFIAAMESGDISAVQAKVDAYAEAQARLTGNVSTATDIQGRFAAAVAEGQTPLQALGGVLNLSGADAEGFATEADKAAQRAKALGTDADTAAGGVDGLGAAATSAAEDVDPMKTALDGASRATSDLDKATKFLALTLDQAAGGLISGTEAANAHAAAMDGIAQSQRDTAQATEDLDQANRDLKTAEDSGTASAGQLAEAHRKVEDASSKVSAAERKQFDANVQTQSTAIALATSLGQQASVSGGLKGATDAATASIEKSKAAFIAAQPEADRLSGKAQNTANALFGIPKDTVARIAESGALNVQGAANSTRDAVNGIPNQHTVTIISNAGTVRNEIDGVQRVINQLTGKTVTITTERREIIRGTTTAVQQDGGHLLKAAEGLRLLGGRGISQRRVGDGDGVTWAEGITGEEFYISMKPGQEARNRAFLSEAAVKLGGRASFAQSPAQAPTVAAPVASSVSTSRMVTVGSVSIGRFDDADRFFDRMAWEQLG